MIGSPFFRFQDTDAYALPEGQLVRRSSGPEVRDGEWQSSLRLVVAFRRRAEAKSPEKNIGGGGGGVDDRGSKRSVPATGNNRHVLD